MWGCFRLVFGELLFVTTRGFSGLESSTTDSSLIHSGRKALIRLIVVFLILVVGYPAAVHYARCPLRLLCRHSNNPIRGIVFSDEEVSFVNGPELASFLYNAEIKRSFTGQNIL